MKYYTIEETAKELEYTPEQVIDLTACKDLNKEILSASVFVKGLNVVLHRSSGKVVAESQLADYGGGQEIETKADTVTGCFEIDVPVPKWDKYGDCKIFHIHAPSGDIYELDGWSIFIPGGLSIKKSQLRISAVALEYFMEESDMPVPSHIQRAVAGEDTLEVTQGQSDCKRAEASAALKSLQTANIDKQIDDVIQTIDAAIRKQLHSKSKNLIVNHIRFLKDAGIDGKKRAKDRVKAYIEKEYSSYGYSVISRRPSLKDDYFVSS